jgi:alkylhydroperoxidase family enzyme
LVKAALDSWETAPLDDKLSSVLRFLQKLNLSPQQVTSADIETMRSAGLSDKAIEEAIYVCFCFNVMDRLADAFDIDILTPKQFKKGGRFLFRLGYKATSLWG